MAFNINIIITHPFLLIRSLISICSSCTKFVFTNHSIMFNRTFRCLFVSSLLLLFVTIKLYAQAPGSISANARVLQIEKFDEFSEGFAVVTNNNETALINVNGDIVVPFKKYYFKKPFKNKNIVLQQSRGSNYAYMNAQLKVFTPFHFAWDADFDTDGIAYNRVVNTMSDDFDFNINQTGIMFPLKHRSSPNSPYMSFTYRYINALIDYNEGMVGFEIGPNGQVLAGFLNRKGVVVPAKYLAVGAFREGLAPVAKRSQTGAYVWGFIDKTGKLAIPFQYSKKPGGFSSGLCYVQALPGSDFDFGYIDKTGALVFKMKYADLKEKGYSTDEFSIAEYSEADYNDYRDLYRETDSPFQGSTLLVSNGGSLLMISKSGEVKNFYDFQTLMVPFLC
jgi:hypothetical protein